MAFPQNGIFALGTASHAFLEFDAVPDADLHDLAARVAAVYASRTTMGAVNQVVGVRPELWRTVAADQTPDQLTGFTEPVRGADGYEMPATQHDVVVWIAGPAHDVVFDASVRVMALLAGAATLADETVGWAYHRDLDLTGFVDGHENPTLVTAPSDVVVPDGEPGEGGSVLLLQKWRHDYATWTSLSVTEQQEVMGRTKALDTTELDPQPPTSHVARTDQDVFGNILRRNTAYGQLSDHGTMFVGFSKQQSVLSAMLASMAGTDGPRDALTRYTTAVTGSYYFVPAVDQLMMRAPADDSST